MSAILLGLRSIGPVVIPCVISEAPESVLEITEIPLENGAKATDHAHSAPFRITLDVATETLTITYQSLVEFQQQRVPFTYVSGFDIHDNLLIERIESERTNEWSRAFRGKITLREVIIVSSASIPGDASQSADNGGEARGGGKNPGGKKSRRAAKPAASRAKRDANSPGGGSAVNRSAGTVNRGDIKTAPVDAGSSQGQSILFGLTQ